MRDYIENEYAANDSIVGEKDKFTKVVVIIVASSLVWILLFNFSGFHARNIAISKYGIIKEGIKTTGLLIRDERVTFASLPGEVELYVKEGERVSTGNHIATISNQLQKDELYNYKAGLISYRIDGLEMTLGSDSKNDLSYGQFMKLKGKAIPISSQEKVNAGRPVFKIIDNFKFYVAVLLPQDKLKEYEVDRNLEVVFNGLKDDYFRGKIDNILLDQPSNIMIIEFNKFIPELINLRKTRVEVIKRKHKGIVLPEGALVEKEGKPGVMVDGYLGRHFEEIEIEGVVDNKMVVKGIGPGVKVVVN